MKRVYMHACMHACKTRTNDGGHLLHRGVCEIALQQILDVFLRYGAKILVGA